MIATAFALVLGLNFASCNVLNSLDLSTGTVLSAGTATSCDGVNAFLSFN